MATAATVTRTNNAEIDGLLGGTKWTGPITYSFPDSPSDYLSGYSTSNEPTTGFARAPAAEQAAINYAVGLIKSYTNASIQFAGAGSADIQIAQSSAANPTSYAYYPSNAAGGAGGDVWFGTFYDYSQAKLGNYEFLTAVHELGHAFGLKHSQETGGVANVAVPSAHDDMEFTVMSYRSYVGAPLTGYANETYGYAQTYMANDILALQTLYGANFSTQSGNTVYSWNPTTGQEFINGVGQLAPGGGAGGSANRVFMTVWDGGGVDTYDLSNYSTAVSINLNPGASSVTSTIQLANLGGGHFAQGNVFNAYLFNGDARSYIDNAIGGASNDTLVGNPIGNSLSGGAGNDRITGGGGNDFIDGGSGSDTAVFSGNLANYRIGWNSATQTFTVADQRTGAPDGTDSIVGVENFQFADGTFSSSSFEMNHAPVVTAADVRVHPGQTLQASSLFSVVDPDNDALTYYFQDATAAANSGYFVVNGTVIAQGASFGVSAAQLAQTVFVAGTGASDDLFVQVSDGQANSNLAEFHVNINHAPVVTVADMSAHTGQTLQVSSLFSATDADNDALTYTFQDSTPDPAIEDYAPAVHTGYFVVNGTAIAAGTSFSVSAAQLAQTFFVVGDAGTSDQLTVQVSDGQATSNLGQFRVSATVNHAPLLTVPASNISATAGQSLQMSSLFSAIDTDNDALTYNFYDGSTAANSGHFVLNGKVIAGGTGFGVSAAQLSQLVYVAGAAGTSDELSMQLSDGQAVSSVGQFHVSVINHAPVLTVPASNISANAGQPLQVSSLFSAGDADNDALIYNFYDGNTAANSGHFVLNGTAIAGGTGFGVNAAQLSQLVFVAGAAGTSDELSMQLSDGHAVSDVGQFHFHVNRAPALTVPASNISATAGQSLQMSSLFSAIDTDNDALTYNFYDGSTAANSGHFVLNGTVIAGGTGFGVSAAQLSQLVYVAGAAGTSDELSMQLSDGQAVSSVGQFHVSVINHAPVLTVPASNISANAGQPLQVSSLFSAGDADNDALTYNFYDGNTAANSGHFVLNGTAIAGGTGFGVNAAQLSQLVFVAGAAGTSDELSMQLSDGHAVSDVGQFHFHVNHAPELTVPASNISANAGQSLQVSSLFSAGDADNDALTYNFYDGNTAANSGHFVLNGTPIPDGTGFGISAAQLSQLVFVAGAAGTSDELSMQLSDGRAVSDVGQFHFHVNHAPELTVPASNISANAGESLQVSSLFSASDADNDALTYNFYDGNTAANSGHFVLNGTPIPDGTGFGVSAAQLSQLVFMAGAAGTSDELSMQLSDGHAVSDVGQFHFHVNHAPVLTVPASNISASPGQSLQVSSLFSAGDADNDALTYNFYDGSTAANSGHFVLNGTPIPDGTGFGVSAAQLSQLVFVAGAAGTSDDLSMQLSDGHAVSAIGDFHIIV